MCIYTKRLYQCWCVDYYIKFANRCTASLRSDKECPRAPYQTKCDVEKVGLCPFHLQQEEAKLVAAGIPNPGYTNLEAGSVQQAETVAKTRYSDPNPEAKSNKGFVDAEAGGRGEPRASGIRTSKTFPQSPPPAAPYRRSDPVLEGRGVPNPWTSVPKTLQRSKTSAQAPLPPPRPNSFQQPPAQERQAGGVPNPWILSPQKLQRSKISAQAPPPPLSQRPSSFQQLPSQPLSLVPNPLHRSNTTTTTSSYLPIHASHLQRASTYNPPTSSTSRAAAKPVQVAIRDERGFFIPPSVYQEPLPPPELDLDLDLESLQRFPNSPRGVAEIQRSSTYSQPSSRNSFQIDPQTDPPFRLQSQRSSTYSQRSSTNSRNSTTIPSENPPMLLVRRATSPTPERRSRLNAEKERRRSNRVSFVYQESDIDDDDGEERGGMYPAPLQRQMQMRAGEIGMGKEGRGEEIRGDYGFPAEGVGGNDWFPTQLQPIQMTLQERKERRQSMRMPSLGDGGTEEEILYSGSEYGGGEDCEIDTRPVVDRNGGDVKKEEMKGRRKSVRMPPPTGVRLDEEEVLYSGSDYDAGEDSDDESLAPAARDRDRDVETGKSKGKRTSNWKGEEEERGRGSVLFEMLYAHASQPQFQPQPQSPPMRGIGSLEERRERRMSIRPLALGGKKGVGGTREGKEGMGMGVGTGMGTDSEYETEYVDTD